MADIKWIKIEVDMFDNKKIKYIRSLPEGNNICLIWIMLLGLAGKCDFDGSIHITKEIPYSVPALANELNFEINTVELALQVLSSLNMLHLDDAGFMEIANWEKYQSVDKLAKMQEQSRLRQKRWYDSHKSLGSNANLTLGLTQPNATDIDKDIDIDKEIHKEKKFIPPSVEEVRVYCQERNNGINPQTFVDFYSSKGWMVGKNKMKDWKACIRTWEQSRAENAKPKSNASYDINEIEKSFNEGDDL